MSTPPSQNQQYPPHPGHQFPSPGQPFPPAAPYSNPAPRKRNVTAIVAGIVVLALIGAGVAFAVASFTARDKEAGGTVQLSDAWSAGVEQTWLISSPGNPTWSPMAASGDRMVVAMQGDRDSTRILTGYDISDADPQKLWERSLTVNLSFDVPLYFWGGYVVHAGQLIDVDTGAVVPAPWGEDALAIVTPGIDYAVACKQGAECAGYDLGLRELWSIPFAGTNVSMAVANGDDAFALMYSSNMADSPAQMINLRTGETTPLRENLDSVRAITPLRDSWVTYREFQPTLVALDGEVSNLEPQLTSSDIRRLVITPGPLPTGEDFRLMHTFSDDSSPEQIVGDFDWQNCIFTVDGARVNLTPEGDRGRMRHADGIPGHVDRCHGDRRTGETRLRSHGFGVCAHRGGHGGGVVAPADGRRHICGSR